MPPPYAGEECHKRAGATHHASCNKHVLTRMMDYMKALAVRAWWARFELHLLWRQGCTTIADEQSIDGALGEVHGFGS